MYHVRTLVANLVTRSIAFQSCRVCPRGEYVNGPCFVRTAHEARACPALVAAAATIMRHSTRHPCSSPPPGHLSGLFSMHALKRSVGNRGIRVYTPLVVRDEEKLPRLGQVLLDTLALLVALCRSVGCFGILAWCATRNSSNAFAASCWTPTPIS